MNKISQEISNKQMLLRKATYNPGERYFHWHERIEVVWCLDKSFNILIDGVDYKVNKGDLIVIDEKMVHKFFISDDNTNVILGQFPYSILLNSGVVPLPVKPVIRKEEISAESGLKQQIENMLNIILNEASVDIGEKNPFMQCMFAAFYFMLMSRFSKNEVSTTTKKEKLDFYKIVEFANNNYKDNITVQSIAKSLYMDRGRLSKLFTKYAGITLTHYINSLRISTAIELIENGTGVTDASYESGFQSVRTFNDVYKKIMHSCPKKIKKS